MSDEPDKIVNLAAVRRERTPHLAGKGHCMACKHQWALVAEIGTTRFECPACGSFQGVLYGACEPDEGALRFECNCGNDMFQVLDARIMCGHCGVSTYFSELMP